MLSYRRTVLKAFAEVEDALTLQASEAARHQSINAQVADDRRAMAEAQQRYRNGQIGLMPVLDSQRNLIAAEDTQVAADLAACLATISL